MKSTNILLADNNLSYLEIARKMLRFSKEGYHVDIATSVEECLEKLLENHYHLLLLSDNINSYQGTEILSQIVKTGLDIPIVMLIDEGRESLIHECMEKGAFDYIVKVRGHLNTLPHTVKKILDRKKEIHPQKESNLTFELKDPNLVLSQKLPNKNGTGYYMIDRKGKFLSVNQIIEQKLHYSEEELLELTLDDLIFPEQVQDYYRWLAVQDSEKNPSHFDTYLLGKHGSPKPVEISITPIRDKSNNIISYKGSIHFKKVSNGLSPPVNNGHFDQVKMVQEFNQLMRLGYDCSLNIFLEKITQLVCKLFQFKRATLALLDRRKRAFVKQIMLGYSNGEKNGNTILEVPLNVIEQVFVNKYNVRVLYHDQDLNPNNTNIPSPIEERRLQKRANNDQWHPNNVIILNLTDQANNTFGYISLDHPVRPTVPSREVFHNLELFSKLTSIAIENYYRASLLEKRNRRLKRLLMTGNIFKLNMTGSEIMRESVWSIKFSLDFNLVMLGLINSKSQHISIKSVACDDRIKTIQLKELSIPLEEIRTVLKKEYRIGKSFLINQPEPALRYLKDIYYETKWEIEIGRAWNWWHTLIIPIFEKRNKIIGFLFVDDPIDCFLPSKETIQTLEILANQLSIAMENRALYLRLRNKVNNNGQQSYDRFNDQSDSGLKRLVEIFFK